jgi:hypothetical protein
LKDFWATVCVLFPAPEIIEDEEGGSGESVPGYYQSIGPRCEENAVRDVLQTTIEDMADGV